MEMTNMTEEELGNKHCSIVKSGNTASDQEPGPSHQEQEPGPCHQEHVTPPHDNNQDEFKTRNTKILTDSTNHLVLLQDESSNSSVGTPFKKALFWPEPKENTLKRKRTTEKLPSVVTSKEWKQYFTRKEQDKVKKEKEKEERKKEREAKKLLKEKTKKVKKNWENISEESDSSEIGSVVYEESSDNMDEFEDEQENAINNDETQTDSIENEKYYAVFYDEQFFIGRVIKIEGNEADIKFLKEVSENSYMWPKHQDKDTVKTTFIFFGPINLKGNEQFYVDNDILLKIKTAYRLFKNKNKLVRDF